MGSEIRVENTQAISDMMESARANYENATTFYEKRHAMLVQNITTIDRFIEGTKARLERILDAIKRCEAELERTRAALEAARREEEAAKKNGGSSSGGNVVALQNKCAKLEAQRANLKQREEKDRKHIDRLTEVRAEQVALLKDWEDRGRAALERCRQETEHAVSIGTQQLAVLGRRPGGR